jgi:peptidoglycan/LPS O-acetylase OafA/YrhL
MKKNFIGLDVLRGLGIFVLLVMHTAFYYFNGLFELDLDNPPLIVTLIGLMLMFAGVFAMISGLVHTYQHFRKIEEHKMSFSTCFKT